MGHSSVLTLPPRKPSRLPKQRHPIATHLTISLLLEEEEFRIRRAEVIPSLEIHKACEDFPRLRKRCFSIFELRGQKQTTSASHAWLIAKIESRTWKDSFFPEFSLRRWHPCPPERSIRVFSFLANCLTHEVKYAIRRQPGKRAAFSVCKIHEQGS